MRLLARLILMLVVLVSAPMAASACHAGPANGASMAHAGGHHQPQPVHAMVDELCIGCIAPTTLHPPVLNVRIAASRLPDHQPPLVKRVGALIQPATPPPRLV